MSVSARLKDLLDSEHVDFTQQEHAPAFTAQRLAEVSRTPGREVVKAVVVVADGRHAIAALPADKRVDFARLEAVLKAEYVRLAAEREFTAEFPDCEPGAMPPIGSLYGMPLIAANELHRDEEIVFNAGTHRDLVRMRLSDWERLARPIWGEFVRGV